MSNQANDFVDDSQSTAAGAFAAAKARAEAAMGEASESKTWTTVKSAARVGLYVGITAGTACVIIAGAKGLANFVFGEQS